VATLSVGLSPKKMSPISPISPKYYCSSAGSLNLILAYGGISTDQEQSADFCEICDIRGRAFTIS
jgi:hypothetical protein